MSITITAIETKESINLLKNTSYEKILLEVEEAKNRRTLALIITSVFFFLIKDVGMVRRAISIEEFEDTEKHIKNLALKNSGFFKLKPWRWRHFLKYGYFSDSLGPSLPKADIDNFAVLAEKNLCKHHVPIVSRCYDCEWFKVPPNFKELFGQLYKKRYARTEETNGNEHSNEDYPGSQN